MIAKVRIAPQEHWCPPMQAILRAIRTTQGRKPSLNLIIEIETTSMRLEPSWRQNPCGGREFQVTGPDAMAPNAEDPTEMCNLIGAWVCEHMLEMD